MLCDMCGKEAELFKAIVEGTQLNVCKSCSRYGKVLKKVKPKTADKPEPVKKIEIVQKEEIEELVVENFPELIKQKREKLGLKQEELAKKLNERESLIQKVESGHMRPSIKLAKKLERFLEIKLIEEFKKKAFNPDKKSSGPLTIGDLIAIKRR